MRVAVILAHVANQSANMLDNQSSVGQGAPLQEAFCGEAYSLLRVVLVFLCFSCLAVYSFVLAFIYLFLSSITLPCFILIHERMKILLFLINKKLISFTWKQFLSILS